MADHGHIITQTEAHVRSVLDGDGSGHDWWHIDRVRNTAMHLAELEADADRFVVELAALLHDIADWKFHGGDENAGPNAARAWLESLSVGEDVIAHVCDIIAHVSYKGAGVATPMSTKEGKIVQDADRLDAIGAIGIARAFAYGGHKNRELWNPEEAVTLHGSFEDYKKNKGSTITHFHEKLLLLKDRMNTEAGRQMAEGRHRYMLVFLEQFHAEWTGER